MKLTTTKGVVIAQWHLMVVGKNTVSAIEHRKSRCLVGNSCCLRCQDSTFLTTHCLFLGNHTNRKLIRFYMTLWMESETLRLLQRVFKKGWFEWNLPYVSFCFFFLKNRVIFTTFSKTCTAANLWGLQIGQMHGDEMFRWQRTWASIWRVRLFGVGNKLSPISHFAAIIIVFFHRSSQMFVKRKRGSVSHLPKPSGLEKGIIFNKFQTRISCSAVIKNDTGIFDRKLTWRARWINNKQDDQLPPACFPPSNFVEDKL